MFFNRKHTVTQFVQLNTQKCKACWRCIKNCSNKVIGKVDLPWHKHALIVNPDACTGCLNCVSICKYGAYSIYDGQKQEGEKQRKRNLNNFLINSLLFISGLLMIFSGLVLQLGFHMGGHGGHHVGVHRVQTQSIQYEQLREIDLNKIVCGLNYSDWSTTHKYVIVFFSSLMIFHTQFHWRWYKGIVTKKLISKNRQVITLSVLFLLAAVTGFIPLFIDLLSDNSILRMFFIEIHDKLTLILIIFFILHIIKKYNWFVTTYAKLKRQKDIYKLL